MTSIFFVEKLECRPQKKEKGRHPQEKRRKKRPKKRQTNQPKKT
jgi:hypothetical protein